MSLLWCARECRDFSNSRDSAETFAWCIVLICTRIFHRPIRSRGRRERRWRLNYYHDMHREYLIEGVIRVHVYVLSRGERTIGQSPPPVGTIKPELICVFVNPHRTKTQVGRLVTPRVPLPSSSGCVISSELLEISHLCDSSKCYDLVRSYTAY